MDSPSSVMGVCRPVVGDRSEPVGALLRLVRAYYSVHHLLPTPWRVAVGERMLGELSECSRLVMNLCRGQAWANFQDAKQQEALRSLHEVVLRFDLLCRSIPEAAHLPPSRVEELVQSLGALERLVRSLMVSVQPSQLDVQQAVHLDCSCSPT
jgi:hypothetical protein